MKRADVILAHKNGRDRQLFEKEAERLIREKYSEKAEREIMRNMLTDSETAMAFLAFIHDIKRRVIDEIEGVLGMTIDVGYTPASSKGVYERVGEVEASASELSEALHMILEGVTE